MKNKTNFIKLIKVEYMYDITIAIDDVDGCSPTFMHMKDGIPLNAQIFIRRIPIDILPTDDEKKCSEFLLRLYQDKVFNF